MRIPQPGDFGLVSIPGGVGFLIRLGQWLNGNGFKNYEHAFVYLDDGTILEAMPGGAIISDPDKYRDSVPSVRVSTVPLTAQQRIDIVKYTRELVGVPYSFLDYFVIAAKRFHLPIPFLTTRVVKSGHMICSQIVDYVYNKSGAHLFTDGRLPNLVDPLELYPFTE